MRKQQREVLYPRKANTSNSTRQDIGAHGRVGIVGWVVGVEVRILPLRYLKHTTSFGQRRQGSHNSCIRTVPLKSRNDFWRPQVKKRVV